MSTAWSIAGGHLSCVLSGEAVILDVKTGSYYGLNESGARVWELMQQGRTVTQIVLALLEEYAVLEAECSSATDALVEQLAAHGLIIRASDVGGD